MNAVDFSDDYPTATMDGPNANRLLFSNAKPKNKTSDIYARKNLKLLNRNKAKQRSGNVDLNTMNFLPNSNHSSINNNDSFQLNRMLDAIDNDERDGY